MSLRIAMVGACPYPAPQGSQVLLKNTALAVAALGHEVHLVVYGYGAGRDDTGLAIHRAVAVPGARRIAAGPSPMKPFLDTALLCTLRAVVRRARIDIIHAHNYEGLMVSLAARSCPVVYHAHNAMGDELPHFLPGGRVLGAWLDRTFPCRAEYIIAPHERLACYLAARGCDRGRMAVIPPSVEADAVMPESCEDALPPVVYTGNLDPYQNLPLLMRAMQYVRATIPGARLLIATAQRGSYPGSEMIHTPDRATLRQVFARDGVVACPRVSWSGYPIKLLNAMAAGKAVVACQSAAPPIVHEENGLLVPDNDAEAFGGALLQLLRDAGLRARLGRRARETVLRDHMPEGIAARIADVYHSLRR